MFRSIKYLLTAGSVLFFLAVFVAPGQPGGSMDPRAGELLRASSGSAISGKIDRITPLGEAFVYERFSPPAFVILTNYGNEPVLVGYSYSNLFFPEEGSQEEVIPLARAIAEKLKPVLRTTKGIRSFSSPVGPLVRTQWGQGRFFNYYCPSDPGGPNGHVLPGCVAVAMSQIVRYYAGYNSVNMEYSWSNSRYGLQTAKIGPYNWGKMENTLVSVNREVCDLLADLSVLLHTTYGASASSANTHRTLEVFKELGYAEATLMRRSDFSADAWTDLLYLNLSEYKPVLVTGGGHAFVCDGYDVSGRLHFNLGGAGYGDGFYLPGMLVLGFPVNEAITDLEPVSWPHPPQSVRLLKAGQEPVVSWKPYESGTSRQYSVYVDEMPATTNSDTLFIARNLLPGIHVVHVSTVMPDGESRWIGPVEIFIPGALLTIQDPSLYSAVLKALGYGGPDTQGQEVCEGDLSRLISLEIDQPVLSLEGIGLCSQLRKVTISGFPGLALDAGPLGNLTHLQVLEWNQQLAGNPEVIGTLANLSELRFKGSRLESWDFLRNLPGLMKFTYTGVSSPAPAILKELSGLDEIDLSGTGLESAGFMANMTNLVVIRISDNRITDGSFLEKLSKLNRIDLSGNQIAELVLTDRLQSLTDLDLHENQLVKISASAELGSLKRINLSGNRFTSPGRMFLYMPALEELNLSDNRIIGMGPFRSHLLKKLYLSGNQLITTDWAGLHPSLDYLDLSNNRISDLSGLTAVTRLKVMDFISVSGNPVSRESFEREVPWLKQSVRKFVYPDTYQPLSPCYPSPPRGGLFAGNGMEMAWSTDKSEVTYVFDLYQVEGDTLILIRDNLKTSYTRIEGKPAGLFKWTVATRTADSSYFSGVYEAYPATEWSVPFTESFESYTGYEPIDTQSDYWIVSGQLLGSSTAQIVTSSYKTGSQSLEISGSAVSALSLEHLALPALLVRFSTWTPSGKISSVRIVNLAGMEIRISCEASGIGRVYLNDKLTSTFTMPENNWIDYRLSANARNNQVFMWAGSKLIVNQPWLFPDGSVDLSKLEFNRGYSTDDSNPAYRLMFVDDISVLGSGTNPIEEVDKPLNVKVLPNPCADIVTIAVEESGRYYLSIFDISGRQVFSKPLEILAGNQEKISIRSLPEGFYSLRLTGASGVWSVRLIKSLSGY